LNSGDALVNATTRLDMSLHLLLLVFNGDGLPHNDLLLALDYSKFRIKGPDISLHLIFYSALSFLIL
jgi:hypothetical protein